VTVQDNNAIKRSEWATCISVITFDLELGQSTSLYFFLVICSEETLIQHPIPFFFRFKKLEN